MNLQLSKLTVKGAGTYRSIKRKKTAKRLTIISPTAIREESSNTVREMTIEKLLFSRREHIDNLVKRPLKGRKSIVHKNFEPITP
jgi:hypothetical protein